MPKYNKLVRDRIPEIIVNSGKLPTTKILNESEYINELKKKAFEELQEYIETQTYNDSIEELADLLEIVHALADYHGSSINEVEEVRKKKFIKRGGFKDKIFLIDVNDV